MIRNNNKEPFTQRQLRVGELIKQSLGQIFLRDEAKVPALETKNITEPEVRMSPDLKNARAYVIPLGGKDTETDVTLAKASNAILVGFNVRPNKEAKKLAENHKITLKFFNIIYEALDFVNQALSGLLKPDIKEELVGSAEVKEIFKVSKIGKVAGSKVIDGEIANNLNARLIRDGNVLYTGFIGSIFREKNAAKQVAAGLECGITLKDFADFKEKDVIEVYKVIETERRI